MKGVLDRIEDGVAVILIEDEGKELTVPVQSLPSGSEEGTYFTLKLENNSYTIIDIDKMATEQARTKTMSLMEQLRKKKTTSKFKK